MKGFLFVNFQRLCLGNGFAVIPSFGVVSPFSLSTILYLDTGGGAI